MPKRKVTGTLTPAQKAAQLKAAAASAAKRRGKGKPKPKGKAGYAKVAAARSKAAGYHVSSTDIRKESRVQSSLRKAKRPKIRRKR